MTSTNPAFQKTLPEERAIIVHILCGHKTKSATGDVTGSAELRNSSHSWFIERRDSNHDESHINEVSNLSESIYLRSVVLAVLLKSGIVS